MRTLILFLALLPGLFAAEFILDDAVLTVRTERYEATFEAGALTGLRNLLTGEVYAARRDDLAARLPVMAHGLGHWPNPLPEKSMKVLFDRFHGWQGGYNGVDNTPLAELGGLPWLRQPDPAAAPTLDRLGPDRVRVTWTGLHSRHGNETEAHPEDSYSLELAVAPDSGDLLIQATAASPDPGVYAAGFAFANFRRDLEFILPLFQGCSFRPEEEPEFRMVSQWPKPFNASIVVATAERGSVAMWIEDPELQDRHFHFHNSPAAFDLMFYSLNRAPFDDSRQALSRPIRLNVYDGNWVVAATPYRDWWERTFQVTRLEDKQPAWLQDVGWRSGFGRFLPPPELAPQCVYFAPQAWKVKPEIGDGGLYPYDLAPGPQLSGRFAPDLPEIQQRGAHVMVYYNINHMNEGHPLAPKFWDQRLRRHLAMSPEERDPKMGSPSSFLVHSAYKPWQDLMIDWMKMTRARFGIRGYYMDCASGAPNTHLCDGMTDIQGQLAFMKRIEAEIPDCFLGVEYVGEATAQVADMGAWGFDGWFGGNARAGAEGLWRGWLWRARHAHPIAGFLFNPFLKMHIFGEGLATPTFHETLGRIETTSIAAIEEGADTSYAPTSGFPELWVRFMCRPGMRPVYPTERWPDNVRAWYADAAGNRYRVESDIRPEGRMIRSAPDGAEELLYWRILGRHRADLPPANGIAGWVAYDDRGAIGLNPVAEYFYQGEPRPRDWQLTALPEGVFIDVVRPYRQGLLVLELGTADGKNVRGECELLSAHELTEVHGNEATMTALEPAADGRRRYRLTVTAPGTLAVAGPAAQQLEVPEDGALELSAQPPAHWSVVTEDGLRQVIPPRHLPQAFDRQKILRLWPMHRQRGYLDYIVRLPAVEDGQKLVFSCRSTITQWKNNSYRLALLVDGEPVFEDARAGGTDPAEHRADLSAFGGRTVLLTIRLHNGMMFAPADLVEPRIARER